MFEGQELLALWSGMELGGLPYAFDTREHLPGTLPVRCKIGTD